MLTQLIDTHCHLYLPEFNTDLQEVIYRAEKEGVTKFYLPCIDEKSLSEMIALEKRFPSKCIAMIGLHPCSVKADYKDGLESIKHAFLNRKWVAIGEIGLDYYWDITFKEQQIEAFQEQLEWSVQHNLPVIIHSRNSLSECIRVVKSFNPVKGIFHCFSGTLEEAREITELGFYLGIGGVLTYKNSGLAEVIKNIPLENLVLETDSPYLAPVPFRGKRNESSYLKFIVQKLAEIKGITTEEVGVVTTSNAQKIFTF